MFWHVKFITFFPIFPNSFILILKMGGVEGLSELADILMRKLLTINVLAGSSNFQDARVSVGGGRLASNVGHSIGKHFLLLLDDIVGRIQGDGVV